MTELQTGARSYGLERGTPALRSIGPIAFGPDGVLFLADNVDAKIVAVDVDDAADAGQLPTVDDLDTRLAALLGSAREDVSIRDVAIHPRSRAVYLAVTRGAGASALPLLIRIDGDGLLSEVALNDVDFAQASIADAPGDDDERPYARVLGPGEAGGEEMTFNGITIRVERDPLRTGTVTDLAYVPGTLLVAGASNEEFTSTLRRIPFPFGSEAISTSLEIFHVSHGKWETHSPIQTFVPYQGGESVLASYTCTPVVQFRVSDLLGTGPATGRTVAELGSMNTPQDIVAYRRGDDEYLLVSNSRHPLLKIACRDIDSQQPLTAPTAPVGVPREELPHQGVSRMAAIDDQVLMLQYQDGAFHLRCYDAAAL